ncbi:MAG: MobH family relaxase [Porticoccaceae bacterium]
MMKRWFTRWRSAPTAIAIEPTKETAVGVVNIALFRDPPFRDGLPVVDSEALLSVEPYAGLIENIKKFADWRTEEFEQVIAPAIKAMADYAGLLPASQSYHHNEGGGALLHALEVGYFTMRLGSGAYYRPMGMLPAYRPKVHRRYQAVLFLAGLFHDIGKLFTDFTVVTKEGTPWNPYDGSLADWAKTNHVDRIFISWAAGRHKKHEARFKGGLNLVLPQRPRSWITDDSEVGSYGADLWRDLEDVLDVNQDDGKLKEFVIQADQQSTVGWMGVNPGSRAEGLAVPVDRYLLDLMRELVGSGKWKCNEKGARLWYVRDPITREEKLFINWILAVRDLSEQIEQHAIPGVPKDANRLADVLVQRSFAEPFEEPNGTLRSYWPFLPERLTKAKGRKKDRPEYGLCVRNPEHFLQSRKMPAIEKAEIGQSILQRLEAQARRSQPKAGDGQGATIEVPPRQEAQSADHLRAARSPLDQAQSAVQRSVPKQRTDRLDDVSAENAQQSTPAQSAEPHFDGATNPCAAQSTVLKTSEGSTKESAQSATQRTHSEQPAAAITPRQNTQPPKATQRAMPVEWKQPFDWIKAVWVNEPSVLFIDGECHCLDVDLLQHELGRWAREQEIEAPQLVHIRQAFAKDKVANLGVGLLGTVWVRKVNAEGQTVRAVWLQGDFYKAFMSEMQEVNNAYHAGAPVTELIDEKKDKSRDGEKPQSLTIEQEVELCEIALELAHGEVSAGGKIRLRVADAMKLLSQFDLKIDDLDEVEFATLQMWMSGGDLLIKKTDT